MEDGDSIQIFAVQPVRAPKHWVDPALPYPPELMAGTSPLSTSIVDSIGADTVAPHILTAAQAEAMAEIRRTDSIAAARAYAEAHSGHAEGLEPSELPGAFDRTEPVSALIAATLVVAGLCARGIGRALRSYRTALFSVRRRENAFDDTHKAPVGASVLLALITVVFGGLALYCSTPFCLDPTFAGAIAAVGCAAAYYVFMFCACRVVGYTFGTPSGSSLWNAGYVATMACTGLALIVPVLLMMYIPQWRIPLLWICAVLFILGKTIFIVKGFRIFYNKIRSLLYSILYLCTLEIIPLLALYAVLSYVEGVQTA